MTIQRSSRRARGARTTDVVVVGAGHSGLAMSHCLSKRGVDHVVLERGEVANSWRLERWDSLRLLTPSWQTALPGYEYTGDDPDGFMTMSEVIGFIDAYAAHISAPIWTGSNVRSVRPEGDRYRVATNRGDWRARGIVVASGAFSIPAVPPVAAALPRFVRCLTSKQYKNPEDLEEGRVLVVGASATGLQLASEINESGRPVTLAVGEHIRMPRRYRGRDVQWWLSAAGILDEMYTAVEDINRARRVPSPQLVGTVDSKTLDLNALQDAGVDLVGRLVGASGDTVQFSGSLANHCAMADLKLSRLLGRLDDYAEMAGLGSSVDEPTRPDPTRFVEQPLLSLDLRKKGFRTIIWATGSRPDHGWLELPVFDRRGRIRHEGGVVHAPGVYVMGLPFMRRRKSSYIHGAEADARDLSAHLTTYLQDSTGKRSAAVA